MNFQKNVLRGMKVLQHQPQLERGEIYLNNLTFRYVYGIDGKLWLSMDSVCGAFGLFAYWISRHAMDPAQLRMTRPQLSSKLFESVTVTNPKGVRMASESAVRNKDMTRDILKLFATYRKDKAK